MKPLRGWAQINPDHPFSAGFHWGVLFNDGVSTPLLMPGSIVMTTVVHGAPAWTSNREGRAYQFPTLNDYIGFTPPAVIAGVDAIGTTTAVTILVVRRKLDTTARSSSLFGFNAGSTAQNVNAHVPYNDGVTYWDFGGTSAPNRLSVAGLSFSATTPERWVFPAGPQGSSIWQNGVKVASQSTAVTRTANANGGFELNHAQGGADLVEFNFFQVIDRQWSDDLCQWWSAEPYAHLYTETARTYAFLAGGGLNPAATTGRLGVLGVG